MCLLSLPPPPTKLSHLLVVGQRRSQAAVRAHLGKHEASDVDGPAGGGVVHRLVVRLDLVVEHHRGDGPAGSRQHGHQVGSMVVAATDRSSPLLTGVGGGLDRGWPQGINAPCPPCPAMSQLHSNVHYGKHTILLCPPCMLSRPSTSAPRVADEVIPHNHNGHARGANVLLRAGVDDAVPGLEGKQRTSSVSPPVVVCSTPHGSASFSCPA